MKQRCTSWLDGLCEIAWCWEITDLESYPPRLHEAVPLITGLLGKCLSDTVIPTQERSRSIPERRSAGMRSYQGWAARFNSIRFASYQVLDLPVNLSGALIAAPLFRITVCSLRDSNGVPVLDQQVQTEKIWRAAITPQKVRNLWRDGAGSANAASLVREHTREPKRDSCII